MIDRNVYCDDILTQMSAIQSALHSVSRVLLENHINTCVIEKLENKDPEILAEFYDNYLKNNEIKIFHLIIPIRGMVIWK